MPAREPAIIPFPQIYQCEPDQTSAIALKETRVHVHITGPLASTAVKQIFSNPFHKAVELEYLFPLPDDAAITSFEIQIGFRKITGVIQESQQASETYQLAVQSGHRAGLLEQRRANLFAVRIGNIQPGEEIQTNIRMQQKVDFIDGSYEYVFPMGITPRYHPLQEQIDRKQVDAPVAEENELVGPVTIDVFIDAGASCEAPASPSHEIEWTRIDERKGSTRFAAEYQPDHDFVLRYRVTTDEPRLAAWKSQSKTGNFFFLSLLPPAIESLPSDPEPREFIFVLDRSGSMSGEPIKQARNALRACLRTLNEKDTFRILLFDDMTEWFDRESVRITQENIDRADKFLAEVDGRGGTEIMGALQEALSIPENPNRMRFIVFLTDGAVSAEEAVFKEVRKWIGAARLFTFGIGPSVNRLLLHKMAEFGKGTSEFLQLDEDIEAAIIRFQDRVSFPVLTGVSLTLENGSTWDLYPAVIPDLYAGQVIQVCGRIKTRQGKETGVQINGLRGGRPVELKSKLFPTAGEDPMIGRAWARAKVDDLLDQAGAGQITESRSREEVIDLALEYQLITPYTSFVAVDSSIVDRQSSSGQLIKIAQPLPKGLDRKGFFGHPPIPAPSPALRLSKPAGRGALMERMVPMSMAMPQTTGAVPPEQTTTGSVEEIQPGEDLLKRMARTQRLNGSWDDDIEQTAAALVAFVRQGHTTNRGNYRQQMRKAAAWLEKASSKGTDQFLLALAFHELAVTTGSEAYQTTAEQVKNSLTEPKSEFERLILDLLNGLKPSVAIFHANDQEELKQAAVASLQNITVHPRLYQQTTLIPWLALVGQ